MLAQNARAIKSESDTQEYNTHCVYAVGKCLLRAVNTEVGALSAMYSYSLNCLLVSDGYCDRSVVLHKLCLSIIVFIVIGIWECIIKL